MYLRLVILVAVLTTIGGAYWYVHSLQVDLQTEKVANALLADSVATLETEKKALEAELERASKDLTKINIALNNTRKERDDAIKTVQDSRLSNLAKAKPGLLTLFARRASVRLWRDFEASTSSGSNAVPTSPTN